jgi:integrase
MGLMKDRHGTWYARVKVPARLQEAVARVLAQGKKRQSFLKKSLGTKELKAANVRAKPVLAGFDRVISEATAALQRATVVPAQRKALNAAEIARMSEALFGKLLADDEAFRFGGRPYMAQGEAQLRREGVEFTPRYPLHALPEFGWSPEQLREQRDNLVHELETMQDALARGDISAVVDDVAILLADFQIDLDKSSAAYRELGTQALRAYVSALQALEKRNDGLPIETPKFTQGFTGEPAAGGTLRDAFEGWNKERSRPDDTVSEYRRAVEMFIQLHGDLPVMAVKKSHALKYREALKEVPQSRSGALLKASLPELSAWSRKYPDAPRVSAGTINKQLGAMQAVATWGYENGVVPEDTAWTNPFAKMRVQGEESERTSFESMELKLLFAAPVFTEHAYPDGGRGPAAFWLPLLTMFNGARQTELAGLTVADVQQEPATSTPLLYITAQASRGKRLKTKASRRVVPIHSQLVRLGFLQFVDDVRKRDGEKAFLFPLIAPDKGRGGVKAYSKWFGRYLRAQGVSDTTKVFHSFRHTRE